MRRSLFDEKQIELLVSMRSNPRIRAKDIADALDMTISQVWHKIRQLGLEKPSLPPVEAVSIDGSVATLSLAGDGCCHRTVIDACDLDAVLSRSGGWAAHRQTRGYVYVCARKRNDGHFVKLHRWLLNPPADVWVDHANGNTLDNRRCNLRFATSQQNCWNSRTKSRLHHYKGIHLNKRVMRWTGTVKRLNGHKQSIGYFDDPIEAAKAWDKLALEIHGEFARLNYPLSTSALNLSGPPSRNENGSSL